MRLPRTEMTFQKWAFALFQGEQMRIYSVPEDT